MFVREWAEEKEKEICLKELAHAITGAGKSNFCRADQQSRDPGKSCCNLESEDNLEVEFFLPQGT